MADVVTTGRGEHEQLADRAELSVSFQGQAAERAAAVAALTERLRPAEPLFAADGVEVRSRRLSVHPMWKGKRRAGYQSSVRLTLRLDDLDALEPLLEGLIGLEPETLEGPRWALQDPSAAANAAQQAAVSDARRRAEGYADALGARLGPLLRLADGVGDPQPYATAEFAAQASLRMAGAPEVRELGLEPAPVTVRAICTTTWTLLD